MSKAEKDLTERATALGRRTKEENIEKWDKTNSPEITDRGGDIRNTQPPFRECRKNIVTTDSRTKLNNKQSGQ